MRDCSRRRILDGKSGISDAVAMGERTMTLTEAGRTFAAVVARVQARQEATLLLKKGKPVARIVPVGSKAKTGRKLALVRSASVDARFIAAACAWDDSSAPFSLKPASTRS